MGTPTLSTTLRRPLPLMLALALGLLLTAWLAGTARAGGTAPSRSTPDTVPVGGQFVVSGNFGANAEVHLVQGENVNPPEDSEPVYTSRKTEATSKRPSRWDRAARESWTVWGIIPATECGDSALVTVTAVPDTAMDASGWPMATSVGALLLALAFLLRAAVEHQVEARGKRRP